MADDSQGWRPGSSLLGAALALPVIAAVTVGAGAQRPPAAGDGAWTTPVQVLLGVAGLGLLVVLVVVVRNLAGGLPRPEQQTRRSGTWLLVAGVILVLVWLPRLAPDGQPPPALDAGGLPTTGGAGSGPGGVPTTTTAVLAGLAAMGLLAATASVALRGRGSAGGASPTPSSAPPVASPNRHTHLPDGPPDAVVLAAWAAARTEVVTWLGAGEHDPPGRLLRRAAGSAVGDALESLTALYLPVRYGRAPATRRDADRARAALVALRGHLHGAPR